jgi:hypothetical protein
VRYDSHTSSTYYGRAFLLAFESGLRSLDNPQLIGYSVEVQNSYTVISKEKVDL